MKTLVLGMGNTILCDDGIGIYVAREAAERFSRDDVNDVNDVNDVDFAEASVGGLRLLDVIGGYERIVMVDAILPGEGSEPGAVRRLSLNDLRLSLHSGSTHDLSLPGALALGRGMGLTLPEDDDFVIIAIAVDDVLTFGETCTPTVEAAIPRAVEAVLAEL